MDKKLKQYQSQIDNEAEFHNLLDTWIQARKITLQESLLDKQFWAFLRGYLNMKMRLLLENQSSILETTIQMFVRTLELAATQQIDQVFRQLTLGDFLTQLKDDEKLQIRFNRYLIDLQIKEYGRLKQSQNEESEEQDESAEASRVMKRQNAYQKLKDIHSQFNQKFGFINNP